MISNKIILIISVFFSLTACEIKKDADIIHKIDLQNRTVIDGMIKSKLVHTTYLPIYTSVYVKSKDNIKLLTSTISIHNMNMTDTLYISKIDYYNTDGKYVRSYVEKPIFVSPMETINMVIHQEDNVGGTGANFLVDWTLNNESANAPLIESIMISTAGQQGISFTSRGVIMGKPNSKKPMKKLNTTIETGEKSL